jgi:hypothetical protein
MSNAIPIGSLIASVIPNLTIKDTAEISEQGTSFIFFLVISNVVISILALPLLFIARSKPPSSPS